MASKETAVALVALAAAVGVLWWVSRPVQRGTTINAVAGLRG